MGTGTGFGAAVAAASVRWLEAVDVDPAVLDCVVAGSPAAAVPGAVFAGVTLIGDEAVGEVGAPAPLVPGACPSLTCGCEVPGSGCSVAPATNTGPAGAAAVGVVPVAVPVVAGAAPAGVSPVAVGVPGSVSVPVLAADASPAGEAATGWPGLAGAVLAWPVLGWLVLAWVVLAAAVVATEPLPVPLGSELLAPSVGVWPVR